MTDPKAHPHYDSSIRRAAERAYRNRGDCFSVWFDGEAIYVRATEAARPPGGKLVCIAQHWDKDAVQLRFTGGYSEWLNVGLPG